MQKKTILIVEALNSTCYLAVPPRIDFVEAVESRKLPSSLSSLPYLRANGKDLEKKMADRGCVCVKTRNTFPRGRKKNLLEEKCR